jgi:molecular chaperone GrpE
MNDDDVIIESDGDEELGGSEDELDAHESRAETKLAKLRAELEVARKEKQENLDGWQRAKADYVNALRRFEEEKATAVTYGTLKAAKAFLPVIDSLERAKEHAKDSGGIPESFVGIVKQLETAAKSLGLEQIGTIGDTFNPLLHEALGQDSAGSEAEDDTITAILEPGWKMGEIVISPAKVRVAHFET